MKKDETRFTIRFNPVDPRQNRTMNALEAAGRRKATLIADALCEYLDRRGESYEGFSLPIITTPAIASNPRKETPSRSSYSQTPEIIADDTVTDAVLDEDFNDSAFDDEIDQAILDGLAAFDL
ncbi:MAG: hypothetical protein FWF81_03025 [Defluviitaleaceae bacterium]|nr:hypothetical protein [Defluviitaleaceae bacterium]